MASVLNRALLTGLLFYQPFGWNQPFNRLERPDTRGLGMGFVVAMSAGLAQMFDHNLDEMTGKRPVAKAVASSAAVAAMTSLVYLSTGTGPFNAYDCLLVPLVADLASQGALYVVM
jgi:hypothetical protein